MARRVSLALAAMAVLLAMTAAQAAAEDLVTEGEHEFVKVTAPNRAMAAQLAIDYDVAYATGDRTATVVATPEEQARLRAAGYTIGATVADQETIDDRLVERRADVRA
jgi:hypothetical protein